MQASNLEIESKELNEKLKALIYENTKLKETNQILGADNKTLSINNQVLSLDNKDLLVNNQLLSVDNQNLSINQQLLHKKAEWLEAELAIAKHNQSLLRSALYGKKSEKYKESYNDQMSFMFNEAEEYAQALDEDVDEAVVEAKDKKVKSKAGRRKLPAHLPREEIIHELKGKELKCDCGGELIKIGSEQSEQLDVVPAKVIVRKHIRYKYACKTCEECVKRANAAFSPLKQSIATSNLLALLSVQKYEDHLPLYRQEKIWQRMGISLSRATMSNWILACGLKLKPLIEILKEEINKADYVCSDETTVNVLSNDKSTNYMWLHMSGVRENRAVVYEYHKSRSGEVASNFLSRFKGYHQCDGYSGYSNLHNKDEVTGVGCMAHARRNFMDIYKIVKKPGITTTILNIIRKLYEIESEIKDLSFDEIRQKRQEKAKPIMDNLQKRLLEYQEMAPPKSVLGKAINYMINQWDKLAAYLENGKVRIDNNDCERGIKPFVIGRKNWMFSNSEKGAQASSVIFSIIETCKANNVNSYNYLRYIFENIHKVQNKQQLRSLLPYNLPPELLDS